jgi:hypothetical protein
MWRLGTARPETAAHYSARVEYPNVKNAHIVPRTYLANWAIEGRIAVWLVPDGKRLADQPVENVGTRRRFYQRERPSGEKINDIEWSLGQGEAAATPLLRSFSTRWPLMPEEKGQLAELFAYQLLRGPRWKAEYEGRTRQFIEEFERQPGRRGTASHEDTEFLLSDSRRLTRMFSTALVTASVFGAMHWTLVEFQRPLIATCDHPVVLWPGAESRRPAAVEVTTAGLLECIEVRLPLSPTNAVLMAWADKYDEDDARVHGTRDHAANFNAFTIAAADRQWFHQPGPRPPVASGRLLPLSTQLVEGYSAVAAASSQRRQRASEIANKNVGRELADREFELVTMSRQLLAG